jgi:hypothetical protein
MTGHYQRRKNRKIRAWDLRSGSRISRFVASTYASNELVQPGLRSLWFLGLFCLLLSESAVSVGYWLTCLVQRQSHREPIPSKLKQLYHSTTLTLSWITAHSNVSNVFQKCPCKSIHPKEILRISDQVHQLDSEPA